MTLAVALIGLLAFWGVYRLQRRCHLFQYLFFWRSSLFAGALLLALPVLAQTWLSSLLANLYVVTAEELALVTVFALLHAWAVMFTLGLTYVGVPARYGLAFLRTHANPIPGWLLRWKALLFGALAAPTVGVAWWRSSSSVGTAALGVGFGVLLATGLWVAWTRLAAKGLDRLDGWVQERLGPSSARRAAPALGAVRRGYGGPVRDELFRHDGAAALTLLASLLYGALAVIGAPGSAPDAVAPLVYVQLLFTLLCLGAAGATFFLDAFRIPPTLIGVALVALSYGVFDTDHEYTLVERAPALSESRARGELPLTAARAVDAWCEARRAEPELVPVFVTSSGGGISAAAWTARVLEGLQEAGRRHGLDFGRSIVLLSTVSGGSVGALHFVDAYHDGAGPSPEDARRATEIAAASSLGGVVWGLLYPDLVRATILPWLSNRYDRGWALEERWRARLSKGADTLDSWYAEVERGRLPTVVFNATLVEGGARLLVTPLDTWGTRGAHAFHELYPAFDLGVATGARLSATFPYVTPLARPPDAVAPELRFHAGDGGYFDNDGLVTALEFIEATEPVLREHGRRRALLLEIRAFPRRNELVKARPRQGLKNVLLGPVLTLMATRSSTQVSRNQREVERFARGLRERGFELESVRFEMPSRPGDEPPFSWQLTDEERARILEAWKADSVQAEVERVFAPAH